MILDKEPISKSKKWILKKCNQKKIITPFFLERVDFWNKFRGVGNFSSNIMWKSRFSLAKNANKKEEFFGKYVKIDKSSYSF